MIALVDCNNFYASCERVFHPEWSRKPLVVLSNNDGCIIARSNESKALGIPMGVPLFQYKELIEAHRVIVCSSNFALYSDLSNRVMKTLKIFSDDFQVNSIDEAFLHLKSNDYAALGSEIKNTVKKWTGIPVSVGIAPTKTLAKIANHKAKKEPENAGVFVLDSPEKIEASLERFPVKDIWGIGRHSSQKLYRMGIQTAQQFKNTPDERIKKHLTVVGLRTAWELRGISCLPLEEERPAKKSITYSRAFQKPINTLEQLQEAAANYAAKAGEKIRRQGLLASDMLVFVELHPFHRPAQNLFHVRAAFPQPTNYSPHFVHYAREAAASLFTPFQKYRKAGIVLNGLVPSGCVQPDLFAASHIQEEKQRKVMEVVDLLNEKYGYRIIRSAAEGVGAREMRSSRCTPRYTTQWDEILTIRI